MKSGNYSMAPKVNSFECAKFMRGELVDEAQS